MGDQSRWPRATCALPAIRSLNKVASSDPLAVAQRSYGENHIDSAFFYTTWVRSRGNILISFAPVFNPDGWPHSITSSARDRNLRGSVRPIALTVLRLIASSTLVGNCTGNSLILAPRKMRSM